MCQYTYLGLKNNCQVILLGQQGYEHDIFVGDTLFSGSIGRTNFPVGDDALMQDSLRRVMDLPRNLRVHCRHGLVTTLE